MQWRSRQYTPKPRGGGGPRGRGGLAARGGRGGGRGSFAGARPSAASGSEDDEDRPRWRRDGNDEDDEPARRERFPRQGTRLHWQPESVIPTLNRIAHASFSWWSGNAQQS